ncbi:MAG: hypothetical protein A2428_08200 [Bdellovibrionales bacterium RIFOXYC1_FULL_54_43]|nr:MAG: hypothetical protein A2428_08200 [Bdellovibrionales bacterium RIFOXYC1_FULL_54_43]OFZ83315.1 MAG: hypothetical protein A2603_11235 [Bdellovibrionales bacterium RIFOXYD1_FULL_55_31]
MLRLRIHSKRRFLRRLAVVCALTAILLGTTAGILWKTGVLQPWLRARLVEAYLRTVAPSLPFQIEAIEIRQSWRELLEGKIADLSMSIRWSGYRARLSGPFQISRIPVERRHPAGRSRQQSGEPLSIQYSPQATFEKVSSELAVSKTTILSKLPEKNAPRSSPVSIMLWTEIGGDLGLSLKQLNGLGEFALSEVGFSVSAPDFKWKEPGVEVKDGHFDAYWDERGIVEGTLAWDALSWSEPGSDSRSFRVENFSISAETPLLLHPFVIGPRIEFSQTGKNAEILWGETYFDIPLSALPLKGKVDLQKTTTGSPRLSAVDLKVGEALQLGLKARAENSQWLELTWKSRPLALRELAAGLLQAAPSHMDLFRGLAIRHGSLQTNGKALLDLREARGDIENSFVEIRDLDFRWPEKALTARKLDLALPFSSFSGGNGVLSIRDFYFRRLHLRLEAADLRFLPRASGAKPTQDPFQKFEMVLGKSGFLPLHIDDVPSKIGALRLMRDGKDLNLETSVLIQSAELASLARAFCLPTEYVPPAKLTVQFSKLEISPDMFNPVGGARLDLFGGTVRMDEMGAFDILSGVPEVDFNLSLDGIRLDLLGAWLGFGEMDGLLSGYAEDVTFQSWLPTRYEFKVEAKPFNRWKVVFSPDAMKNFVRLFAGEDIDHLPGFADWLAFGWPSRIFGGYDVWYAGIKVISADGIIVLETLDPPALQQKGKHFILYGPRFEIPLKSSHYPFVADATAMSNYLRLMALQLGGLRKNKPEPSASKAQEKKDENDTACLPPE